MTFGLTLRFWFAKACFRMAQVVAGWLLHAPKLPAAVGAAGLPAAGDTARGKEIAAAKEEYALVPTSKHFGITVDLGHDTLRELPKGQKYPPRLIASKAFLQIGFNLDVSSPARWQSFDEVLALYSVLGVPDVAARWRSDEEFARQRVMGPNPVWIERVRREDQLRGIQMSDLRVDGPTPDLYIFDLRPLLAGVYGAPGRHVYPCAALFREVGGKLVPIGIQLDRPEGSTVVLPNQGSAWMLAKMFVQCADIWVHEVVTHYFWCHVIEEKIILATCRTLAARHPVRRLLDLHVEHTLNLNRNGLKQLMGDGGYFDEKFSPGPQGKAVAVAFGIQEWGFWRLELPENVARRDMEALADYPWRDDGRKVWDAVTTFVEEYTSLWYADDDAVLADVEVQAWSAELQGVLGQRGVPVLDSLAALRRVLVAAIFQVVHHDLVNAPQFQWYGFPPSSPPILSVPFPDDPAVVTEAMLVEALPNVGITLNAILATYGFSTRYNAMGDHGERYFSGPSLAAWARHRERLAAVDVELRAKNAGRSVAYPVALPSNLAGSISA